MFRGLGILVGLSVCFSGVIAQTRPELGSFTHEGRTIWYHAKEGMAVTEGDILLGPVDRLLKGDAKDDTSRGAAIPINPNGSISTWPQGQIFYVIDPDVPNQRRITDAIAHWNTTTPVRLVPRTGQSNYVRFIRPANTGYCASFLGMRGGEQAINLGDLCSTGSTIHEIGHAAGLLHEQDRTDRNRWITIQYENVAKFDSPVFAQFTSVLDAGFYNYDSIMHYSPFSFTNNIQPVILTVPLGIPVGVRTTLSPGDIDTISRLYGVRPALTTVATMPSGLLIEVDGKTYTSPQSFDWAVGSTHTVSVTALQPSTSATRHRFVRWTDGGALSHTFTAAANQTVIAATFSREHRISTEVFDGNGTVNVYPPSPDGYYPVGARIRVSAFPEQGQQFLDWLTNFDLEIYDIGYGSREFEISVYGNLLFGAFFTDQPTTTIDVAPNDYSLVGVDGDVWVPPVRFAWEPGEEHLIATLPTAFSYDGTMRYRFQNWSDGSKAGAREIVAGDTNVSYIAQYRSEAEIVLGSTTGGRLFINPGSTDGFFPGGSTLLLRAVPDADQDLIFWLGDINGRGKNRAILMDRPRLALSIFDEPVPLFPFNAAHRRSSPLFDYPAASVTPLTVTTINVANLGLRNPAEGTVVNGRYSTSLENIRVLFDGVPAPILRLLAPDEITVVVPAAVGARPSTLIEVERGGQVIGSLRFGVTSTAPGIFTADESGYGPASARNEDGSPNSSRNPAVQGSVVALRVTGAGLMNRALPDGAVTGSPGALPRSPIYVRINGLPAEVLSAEPVSGEPNGVLEVKVRIPEGLIPGELPVQFIAGIWPSPPFVTLSIR